MHPERAAKLAKILWKLFSDSDAEVLAAGRAAARMIQSADLDLEGLTRLLSGPASSAGSASTVEVDRMALDRDIIRRIRQGKGLLTTWDSLYLDKCEYKLALGESITPAERINLQEMLMRATWGASAVRR
jgi:predicted nuclease of predicted toxin-antitoxin system